MHSQVSLFRLEINQRFNSVLTTSTSFRSSELLIPAQNWNKIPTSQQYMLDSVGAVCEKTLLSISTRCFQYIRRKLSNFKIVLCNFFCIDIAILHIDKLVYFSTAQDYDG